MILYNTTFVCDKSLHAELCVWLRTIWLPSAAESGMKMPLCAYVPAGEDQAISIAVQGRFIDDTEAESWHADGAVKWLEALYGKYGERILAFSTLMEVFEP